MPGLDPPWFWTPWVGHLIECLDCPPWLLLPPLFAKLGSNLRLNCSNFSRSMLVTDLLAVLKASSKCFLVISGTGSKFWALPPFYIKAFILASASIESLTADFAAFWQIYVKSAPENPSVMLAKKLRSTSFEIGVLRRFALRTPKREGWSGKGM